VIHVIVAVTPLAGGQHVGFVTGQDRPWRCCPAGHGHATAASAQAHAEAGVAGTGPRCRAHGIVSCPAAACEALAARDAS